MIMWDGGTFNYYTSEMCVCSNTAKQEFETIFFFFLYELKEEKNVICYERSVYSNERIVNY